MPFFTSTDVTSPDRHVVCRSLTAEETAKLGWRGIRLLRWLETVPIIP